MHSWWDLGESIGQLGTSLSLYQIECPFCGETGNFSTAYHAEKKKPNSDKVLNFDTLKCGSCSSYVMVLWSASEYSFGGRGLHAFRVLPFPIKYSKAPDHYPPGVGRNWLQAHRSMGASNYDAAAVMARTSMQAALRDKHATGNNLLGEINSLATNGTLPPLMIEWSHEVRLLGNAATHPDPQDTGVSQQDAEDIVEFLDYLLEYLYDLPKRIEDYRNRPR